VREKSPVDCLLCKMVAQAYTGACFLLVHSIVVRFVA